MKTIGVILILFGLSLFAGNESGHGGGTIVKRDASEKIISVELLDFYEAIHEHRLTLKSANPMVNATEIAQMMVKRLQILDPNYFDTLEQSLKLLKLEVLDPTVRLEPTNDIFPKIGSKIGKIETLANYIRENLVLVDGEIWPLMTENQKAGLILHELLYATLRAKAGVTDSRKARKLVAFLFSTLTNEEIRDWYEHTEVDNVEKINTLYQTLSGAFVGDYMTEKISAAQDSWEKRCDDWKIEVKTMLGTRLILADCGEPELQRVALYYFGYDHKTYSRFDKIPDYDRPQGWQVRSRATLITRLPTEIQYQQFAIKELRVDYVQPFNDYGYIRARYTLTQSRQEACKAWSNKIKKNFSGTLLYISCNSDLDTRSIKTIKNDGSSFFLQASLGGGVYYLP